MIVQPGAIGVDDSFSFPDGDQLQAVGVDLEVRYFSTPDGNPKNWTDAQFADRHARGIATLAIHEQFATDHLGGEPAGRAKAGVFARLAEKRGYPRNVPAMVSCDSSVTAETLDYAGGFHDQIKRVEGWQLAGAYGFGPEFVQALWEANICTDVLWQAYAGSAVIGDSLEQAFQRGAARWGDMVVLEQVPGLTRTVQGIHLMAHAFQCLGSGGTPNTELVSSPVDWNRVFRPITAWLPGAPPPSTGDDIMIMRVKRAGANASLLGDFDSLGRCRHLDWLDTPEVEAQWAGAPLHDPLSPEAVRNMSIDRLPQGDGAHAWDRSDVRFVYDAGSGGQGPKGDVGPAGPAGPAGVQGPAGDTSQVAAELADLKAKLRAV